MEWLEELSQGWNESKNMGNSFHEAFQLINGPRRLHILNSLGLDWIKVDPSYGLHIPELTRRDTDGTIQGTNSQSIMFAS